MLSRPTISTSKSAQVRVFRPQSRARAWSVGGGPGARIKNRRCTMKPKLTNAVLIESYRNGFISEFLLRRKPTSALQLLLAKSLHPRRWSGDLPSRGARAPRRSAFRLATGLGAEPRVSGDRNGDQVSNPENPGSEAGQARLAEGVGTCSQGVG